MNNRQKPAAHCERQVDRTAIEQKVLHGLATQSYEEVAGLVGRSRGFVYQVALKHGARKNERRIQERVRARKDRQKAFLQEVMNATVKADVLDFLDGIPDSAMSAWITSPPYNVGKVYGGHRGDRERFHFYLGWLLQVLSEMDRTLSDGGVLFLQVGSTRGPDGVGLYPLDALLFEHLRTMGLTFQSRVVWTIPHGLTPKGRLAERHETALVFSKGAPRCFNATPARRPQKQPDKRAFKGPNRGRLSGSPLGAWPTNVWDDVGNVGHNSPDRHASGTHPAQFPAKMARRAILLYTLPGDLVGDPFVGSGTVAEEAIRTGRAFTGADLFYEDSRRDRLAAVAPDLISELPGVTDESVAVWQAEARAVTREPEVVVDDPVEQLRLDLLGGAA